MEKKESGEPVETVPSPSQFPLDDFVLFKNIEIHLRTYRRGYLYDNI